MKTHFADDETLAYIAELEAKVADLPQPAAGSAALMDGVATLIREMFDERGDIDGGWLQERATELGVLIPVAVTEPCGERCDCADLGGIPGTCYRVNPLLAAAPDGEGKR